MRISWFSHYFSPEIGAPSARIHDLSRGWIKNGHQVDVVTCFPNHPTGTIYPGYRLSPYMSETISGIRVHRVPTYITPNRGFVRKLAGHVSLFPSSVLLGGPRLDRTDVVIGTSPTFFAAMGASATAMLRGAPFVMEVRDLWPAIFVELGVLKNPMLIRWIEKMEIALYRLASRVVTVTESFRRNLLDRGIPEKKVVTIPNGADTEFWTPVNEDGQLRSELGLDNKCVVLYIGAHGISQGLSSILDAAALLENRSEIEFVFVGEGAEKSELIKKARRIGLRNVCFLPPVDKEGVTSYYAMADVCLVPLRDIPLFDSFIPSKMFEIMAMGRPILGSLRGEAAGIIERSGGGVVLPPETPERMAAAIVDGFDRPGELAAMGRAGRMFVEREFSRDRLAGRYESMLREVVAERGAGRG